MRDGATQKFILYSIADVCSSHTTLDSSGRNVTFPYQPSCDNTLTYAWYRLTGESGSYLPESCPQPQSDVCGTMYPGWLNGIHPTVAEGVVTRTACFSTSAGCCIYLTTIEVKNCGDFYVYKLPPAPTCNLRYCVTNVGEYHSKPRYFFSLFFFQCHCSHCFQTGQLTGLDGSKYMVTVALTRVNVTVVCVYVVV